MTQPSHTLFVAPASDMAGQEVPADWLDEDKKPKTFAVNFIYGKAEVESTIGKYLLDRKMVKRTALILPEGVRT